MVDVQCVRGLSLCESVHGGEHLQVCTVAAVSLVAWVVSVACGMGLWQLVPAGSAARVLVSVIGDRGAPRWRSSPWEVGGSWVAWASGCWWWSCGCSTPRVVYRRRLRRMRLVRAVLGLLLMEARRAFGSSKHGVLASPGPVLSLGTAMSSSSLCSASRSMSSTVWGRGRVVVVFNVNRPD